MSDQYHHGVRIIEKSEGARPIRTVNTAVIGLVGTAPDSTPAVAATGQIGVVASDTAIALTSALIGQAGNSVTITVVDTGEVDEALAVAVDGNDITVTLATDGTGDVTSTAADVINEITSEASALVTAANATGSDGSGVMIAEAKVTLTGGVNEPFPLNTPVLVLGNRAKAAQLDSTGRGLGTLPAAMTAIFDQIGAMVVVVRVAEGIDDAATTTNVIGSVVDGKATGLLALKDAQAQLGVKPRILGVPGLDHLTGVIAAMVSVADDLRAFAYAYISADTMEAAVTARDSYGSKRLMLLWPEFAGWNTALNAEVALTSTARALGVRARADNEVGWHKTLSNIEVNGVTGISKSVHFDLTNVNTDANYLNGNEITTLIRSSGFRFWGSRTCSNDPVFAFESAARTGDILADTIAEAHMWAMDKPMSKVLIKEIVEGINAKFRSLKASGYIVDAYAYVDTDLNTTEQLAAGKLTISYDYTPVPPLEDLTFIQTITDRYLVQLVA
ncbi:phage tail sheath subtilisin-like domain-containing protein [Spongiibacter tropicus]|uniref:phage tail sheath subtilisin-like domain-containing protein n=1 Tax=Spongiibacter tropicus TaxID=454602 RepID=UPI0035BE8D76